MHHDPHTPPAAASVVDDLFSLTLVDGIKVLADGKPLIYRRVQLRETSVADERTATRLAERVVMHGGAPKLLVSERDFGYAMTMLHIDALVAETGEAIRGAAIDLNLFGKLSSHDLGLIEHRVFLISMAAEVRYGALSQAELDKLMRGEGAQASPQPAGQAADLGAPAPQPESGPALLADYAGSATRGSRESHGG